MGRLVFLALHLAALIWFPPALIATIAAHLIYSRVGDSAPDTSQHVRCPHCQEFAHMDASVCPHCRRELVPYFEQRRRRKAEGAGARASMAWWQRF